MAKLNINGKVRDVQVEPTRRSSGSSASRSA